LKSLLKFILILMLLHAVFASAAITVTNIAQGSSASHSLFIKSDSSLWAMGGNTYGQLGDGTGNGYYGQTNKPEEIVASNVVAIAVGGLHSLFLKSDGSLWAMGNNESGQLGDGKFIWTNKPEEIINKGVTAIAAGGAHSLFLKSDGSLWAMGNNAFGQLGDGTFSNINRPKKIVSHGVKAIAAGGTHSLFLKSDGSLWAMGNNIFGQLGDGTSNYSTNKPEEIVSRDGIAIATKLSHDPFGQIHQRRSHVTAIAAGGGSTLIQGYGHSLFLKSDGSLWAMGNNNVGQLGDGTFSDTNQPEEIVPSGVTAIAAGGVHSLFLKSDSSLWVMGDNYPGQLGISFLMRTNLPVETVASNVLAIAAGALHSLFLKSDGSLWGMGRDGEGELGDGFLDPQPPYGTSVLEQIYPSPQPVLAQTFSNTDLQFTANCGFGGNFYLLASTNLAQPLNQWTPVWTNVIRYRFANIFSVTLTNAVNSGNQQFYILQSQ
jgi:alpha-tubulin suppressor-like RCC1 family protein